MERSTDANAVDAASAATDEVTSLQTASFGAAKAMARDGDTAAADQMDSRSQRGTKREMQDDNDSEHQPKQSRLSARDVMQLKLLAAVPQRGPLRDERGRRRSTCISSEELVEAGLTALVTSHTSVGANPDEEDSRAVQCEPDTDADDTSRKLDRA